ncbi:MAG: flagellar hook-length control protein FliK [Aliarcobacter skirrowii]|uniref:flagellar hook-length control protein FliK n=1 Tax=Aliarcobacter skirrowii TaxID=28200 RepID=UPI00242C671F|nr:flagellar hook-length control protein FliK [Aliarcobacter skirrowii]MDD2508177.1 flagellar hook-length control protein FliK [Aliarcobacter skirrowii]MDD3496757.1 flagellar hook-length control protein FliK [Aliarcobacter skirrowii]
MTTLIDLSSQTSESNGDNKASSNLKNDSIKTSPSLFDTLLNSVKNNQELENSENKNLELKNKNTKESIVAEQNIENKADILLDEDISNSVENSIKIDLDDDKTTDFEKVEKEDKELALDIKKDNKSSKDSNNFVNKNSLLDRMILEVKNSDNTQKRDLNIKVENISNNFENSIKSDTKKSQIDILKIDKQEEQIFSKELSLDNTKELKILEDGIDNFEDSLNISKEINKEDSVSTKIDNQKIDKLVIENSKDEVIKNGTEIFIEDTINKENLKVEEISTDLKENEKSSLMDKLIEKNSLVVETNKTNSVILVENKIEKNITQEVNVNGSKSLENKQSDSILASLPQKGLEEVKKTSLMDTLISQNSNQNSDKNLENSNKLTDIEVSSEKITNNKFVSEDMSRVEKQLLFNKKEAVNILENAKSIEDIKHSAQILDLEASELEVSKEITKDSLKNIELEDKKSLERKTILNTLLNEKNIRSVDVRNLITNSIEASNALLENSLNIADDVTIDVTNSLTNQFSAKIVAARQQLGSMMSDIARQMYENYKPPVTAFRININPQDMGTISVLMKHDRLSGLNITLSVSSLTTLELLMENQNMLRNSLVKTFSDSSSFNLDFNQGDNNSSSKEQSSNKNRQNSSKDTQSILKLKEENRDLEDKNDYM